MFEYCKSDIENLIKKFVKRTLSNEAPENKCFAVCYALSVYLSNHNIQHTIKSGVVKTPTKNIGHYIITLKDYEAEIIDPTAQQIDKNNPQVLMQKKPDTYLNFTEFEVDKAYETWEYLLLNNGYKKPLPPEVLQDLTPEMLEMQYQQIDIVPYLRILVRAYSVFNEEFLGLGRKGQRTYSESIKLFLDRIYKIANHNKDKKEKLGSASLITKFENILRRQNFCI